MKETTTLDMPASNATVLPMRHRRVAILGFGRSVRQAPVHDPAWELWALNGFWRAAKPDFGIDVPEERYSVWFDTHSIEFTRAYGAAAGIGDAQERWLEQLHPFPILMLESYDAFPACVQYPLDEVVAQTGRDFFTSTVAYALAFALVQPDIAEVGLWGIDLAHATEYEKQQPCAAYWCGRLEGAGVKVTLPAESELLKHRYRYGCERSNPLATDLRVALSGQLDGLTQAIEDGKSKLEEITGQMRTNDGARQIVAALLEGLDTWSRGGSLIP